MAKDNMETLRGHLFDTITQLKAGTMKVDQAQAISDVGRTILESAKVEMAYMKMTDASKSGSALLGDVGAPVEKQLPPAAAAVQHNPAKEIAGKYGKAQGVYYELDQEGEMMPVSLETMTERIGSSGLKLVPSYLSVTEMKKKMVKP